MADSEKRSSDPGERPPLGPRQWPSWLGIGLAWLVARLPWAVQRPLGRGVGALLYRLLRDRRHVARRNIALCFPELDASRQEALARANFGELGIGLFEFARAWWGDAVTSMYDGSSESALLTGLMWFAAGQEPDIATNPVLKFLKKRIRITDQFDGEKLSTMINGVKHYTPLFVVLILIGTTDIIFAVDSIPAIFAITSDPFIVLTANIFAILGLRALYFLLADLANRFHLLAYGLALVLVFIGGKMLLIDFVKIPIGYALLVTASLIAGSIFLSLRSSGESAHGAPALPRKD